jgi:hypothetical protein
MAVMMIMQWNDVTLEQYDRAREVVNWEGDVPPGALFHVAAYDGKAMRITDVWESGEQFQQFVVQRLTPGVQQVGIQGEPQVEIYPAHRIFAPAYATK